MLQEITVFNRTIGLYDLMNNLAYVAHAVLFVLLLKRVKAASTLPELADAYFNKQKKKDAFHRWFYVVVQFLIMYLPYMLLSEFVGPLISRIFMHTADANFFVNIFFFPVYGVAVALLFRVAVPVFMDACALLISVSLIFFKLACFCHGCCNGIACESPFFNRNTGRSELPVQLIEAGCALLIAVFLIVIFKRNKKSGLLFPLFMLLYCGTRFVSEFWRDDFPAVWGPLKPYHIQCIVGFAAGAVYLAVVLLRGERITAFFDAKNKAFADKCMEKIKAKKKHTGNKKKKR